VTALATRLLALVLAATALVAFVARLGDLVRTGRVEWWAIGLAVFALTLLAVGRRWKRADGVALLGGATASAVLAGIVLVGFVPAVRREVRSLDHVTGGRLGAASSSDWTSVDLGPRLLPRLDVAGLLDDPWADETVAWVALRVQGRAPAAIVGDPRYGRRLLLGVLRDEASPPRWWNEAWRSRLAATPAGTRRMGLIPEEVARAGLRAAGDDARSLAGDEHRTLVLLAGVHPGLLTADEAEAVLRAWRERLALLGGPLEAVLAARSALATLLGPAGTGGPVGVRVEAASAVNASLAPAVESAVRYLVGTLGHRVGGGNELRIAFTVEEREYWRVRRDHAVLVPQGLRAPVRTETETRWVGRYWLPLRRNVPVTEYEPVARRELRSFDGLLRAPVLVLHVAARGEERTLEAPPFGFLYCDGPDRAACGPVPAGRHQALDTRDPVDRAQYRLPDATQVLLASWLMGLPPTAMGIGPGGSTSGSEPR
jgi:hypothetical protein